MNEKSQRNTNKDNIKESKKATTLESKILTPKNSTNQIANPKGRILLAEDGPQMRELIAKCLIANGYLVEKCGTGHSLISSIEEANTKKLPFDLVISDVKMPGITAIKAIDSVDIGFFPPTILMSAFADEQLREEAKNRGVIKFFAKPFEIDDLINYVSQFFDDARNQIEHSLNTYQNPPEAVAT